MPVKMTDLTTLFYNSYFMLYFFLRNDVITFAGIAKNIKIKKFYFVLFI